MPGEITRIEKKLKDLDPSTIIYQTYASVLVELKKRNAAPITLHKDTGPTCEGCQ